jgi:citronellyl-CoA synthetase
VREIDVGFALGLKHYQFVDRTGDTFRWRAENVSTNEVAEVLNQHPQIEMANVYGVEIPGVEGKAGMAALAIDKSASFDLDCFTNLVDTALPAYARPVFLRIQRTFETTGTFKLVKTSLREEAYHPERVGDDVIYVRPATGGGYRALDADLYEQLRTGIAGY